MVKNKAKCVGKRKVTIMDIALTGLMLLLGFMATLDWGALKRRQFTKIEVDTDPRFR